MVCPDENEVLELFDGRVGAEGMLALQSHIDGCAACRLLVAELARTPSSPSGQVPPDDREVDEDSIPTWLAEGTALAEDATLANRAAEGTGSARDLPAGSRITGDYRLDRLLGEGAVGVVWAATHMPTGRAFALKFLKVPGREHVRRFLREARITGTLRHPHIVEVHDILEISGGTPVMVLALLHGEALQSRLSRGPMSARETARVILPVVSAVGAAHAAGVVHRDLKPENIFLVQGAEGMTNVKVLDFGLAKVTSSEGRVSKTKSLTRTGSIMGTPHYMSPEQVCAEKDIDHRADVWALGVILYQCISGRRPITGKSFGQIFRSITAGAIVPLQEVVPGLPPALTTIVARMLMRDRRLRPADLREVFQVLSEVGS